MLNVNKTKAKKKNNVDVDFGKEILQSQKIFVRDTVPFEIYKEKKGFSAVALGIDGVCATQADTYEELLKNIDEVLALYLEGVADLAKSKLKSHDPLDNLVSSGIIMVPLPSYA